MGIRFLCPNGHKVRCEDKLAGREEKCPQCGVRFRVPAVGSAKDLQVEKIEVSAASESDVSKLQSQKPQTQPKEPQIEYLCPSGHRLNGPASLQGRPGQCPECGAKFLIPTYDQAPEEEGAGQEFGSEEVESGEVAEQDFQHATDGELSEFGSYLQESQEHQEPQFPDFTRGDELEHDESEQEKPVQLVDEIEVSAGRTLEISKAPSFAMAGASQQGWEPIVVALLSYKSPDVVVEILLSDGDKIVPDRYSSAFSSQGFGLFAVQDSSGMQTITAVAWSSVSQVVVQGIDHLPDELFG